MPILSLQLTAGYSSAQKTELLKKASQAVVDTVNSPISNVRVALNEIATEHSIVAGEMGQSMATYVVYLIVGRTEEQKAALMKALTKATVDAVGISDQQVRVLVHDMPKTDIGLGGGLSAKASGR